VTEKTNRATAVRKAILGASLSNELLGKLKFRRDPRRKIKIKLEVDTNPPAGSNFEVVFVNFPQLTMMTAQTMESAFASKSHALLCREYTKGRDWYDFLFYVSRRIRPNFTLLKNALNQRGPWAGTIETVTQKWYTDTLSHVIENTNWQEAARDVQRFLSPKERETTELWNTTLFAYHVQKLREYLSE
jgi:hypothetical protein